MTSRTRAGGLSTRRQVASRTVAQVPSEPTSARATWKPLSGSRWFRLYPETRRGMFGKLAADLLAVAVGDGLEAGVDFGAASAFADDAVEVFGAGCAHVHALAVVGEDFERLDVVVGLAGHDRVHAAGVVADHAAEGAAVVGGGIGREGQVMLLGCGAEVVENHSGLNAGDAALRDRFRGCSPCTSRSRERWRRCSIVRRATCLRRGRAAERDGRGTGQPRRERLLCREGLRCRSGTWR